MQANWMETLQQLASWAFWWSFWLFVAVNAAAVAVVAIRRDRDLVNRWTSRLLAVNLVLAGTGLGIPVAAHTTRALLWVASPLLPTVTQPGAIRPETESRAR